MSGWLRTSLGIEIAPNQRFAEGKPVHGSRGSHSGQRLQLLDHLVVACNQLLSTLLLVERKIDSQDERAFRMETGIHGTQPDEALNHKSGADQQHKR